MSRQRVVLQKPITLPATTAQLNEDAVQVGDNTKAVVFANCYAVGGTGTNTVNLQTCANLEESTGASNWITIGTITFTGTGSKKVVITDLGDAIRWSFTSPGTATTFGLVVFLTDFQ